MKDAHWVEIDEASNRTGYTEEYIRRLCDEDIVTCGRDVLGRMLVSVTELVAYDRDVAEVREDDEGT